MRLTDDFLYSGVKKLFIVAIAYDVEENYDNLKILLDALGKKKIDFSMAMDLKCTNLVVGLQSHAAKHPCHLCEASQPFNDDELAPLRTIGTIRKQVEAFNKKGRPLQSAKDFKNCINMPLLQGDNKDEIISLIPPCELHLLTGVVSKILTELDNEWKNEKVQNWLKNNNITMQNYYRFNLNGNSCKKILQKADDLRRELPMRLKKFADCLVQFNLVRLSCFSKVLNPSYKSEIMKFRAAYKKLNIPQTTKIHIVCVHVSHFCEKFGVGLGYFSEQASEAVHADFLHVWNDYKKLPPSSQSNLFRAVVKYNSFHI